MAADCPEKLISRIEGREKKAKEKKILSQYIYNNGIQYFNKGNFEAAIPEFKKALREDAQCLSTYIILGDALYENWQWESRIESLGKQAMKIPTRRFA